MAPWPYFLHRNLFCASRVSASVSYHTVISHLKALTAIEHGSVASDWEFGFNRDGDEQQQSNTSISASSLTAIENAFSTPGSEPGTGGVWKVLKQGEHSLDDKFITDPAWFVLSGLQERGYEAYLVGGSVRDMLLKQVPKDFDVLTTADPKQIQRSFLRTIVVGRRFPICHVTISNKTIEVSSFSTSAKKWRGSFFQSFETVSAVKKMKGLCSLDERDIARWENCLKRDFTINGLMYDPIKGILYDYVGGIQDLRRMKVRTVIPADNSFDEDCARLLRAIRIAARLGFTFSRDITRAIQSHTVSIMQLDKARLVMEVNYMLAYGAAEASMRLLWRFGVLEILLPLQAAYFASTGFKRRDTSSNILLKLLANLDKIVAPDRPCHQCLWLGLLAMHLALVGQPRSQVIISAFALALYRKKGVMKAVQKAKQFFLKYGISELLYPEVDESGYSSDMDIEHEVLMLRDDVIDALNMMYDGKVVASAMQRYSQAPRSNVVLLSRNTIEKCEDLFYRIHDKKESEPGGMRKPSIPVNYDALLQGDPDEASFVFSRILINTLYPFHKKSTIRK